MDSGILKALVPAALVFALVGCDDDDDDLIVPQTEVFTVTMNGQSEVPPVTTEATGTATFTTDGATVDFTIDLENIVGVVAAHIHPGVAGENGPVVVPLFDNPAGVDITSGELVSSTFTAEDIDTSVGVATMDELLTLMRTGGAYVNVHTVANPAGEIRGQIQLQ